MSDMFAFIDDEYAANLRQNIPALSIGRMCALLDVSRSGFYEWRDRPASASARRRDELAVLITRSFENSQQTYGYRRVHADLVAGVSRPARSWSARSCAP